MRALVVAIVVAWPGLSASEPLVVDDARTVVRANPDGTFAVTMFYADGGRFAAGTFRQGSTAHPVHWRPVGWGTIHHPGGRVWVREHARGVARYVSRGGRLFATARRTAVTSLGAAVRRHPGFQPCRAGRLHIQGPTWTAASSAKHFYGLTRLFTLYCGEPANETLHSRWHPDGTLAQLRRADGTDECFAVDGQAIACAREFGAVEIVKRRQR